MKTKKQTKNTKHKVDVCLCGHERKDHFAFGGGCPKCGVDPASIVTRDGVRQTTSFQCRPGSCERFSWNGQR